MKTNRGNEGEWTGGTEGASSVRGDKHKGATMMMMMMLVIMMVVIMMVGEDNNDECPTYRLGR